MTTFCDCKQHNFKTEDGHCPNCPNHMNTQKSDEELVEAVIENATDHVIAPDGKDYPYVNADMLRKELKTCITTIRQEAEERERTLLTKHEDAVLERVEEEIGGFHPGWYATLFDDKSEEAKHWNIWKGGYDQSRKDALNVIKYERKQN